MMKSMEDTIVFSDPLPADQCTWFVCNGLDKRHLSFYSIKEDCFYVRCVPELLGTIIRSRHGKWFVLQRIECSDSFLLNILTGEKIQIPPVPYEYCSCVLSSSKMDKHCRIIFFHEREEGTKFSSCYLGDTEYIERDFGFRDTVTSFDGKLYGVCLDNTGGYSLIAADFSDPDLHPQQVFSGESISHLSHGIYLDTAYLVESCGELFLIILPQYETEVYDVNIFRADLRRREWVKIETLGDRVFLLGWHYSFSSPASACGLKGNVVYWTDVRKYMYMYDVDDESITMKVPCRVPCSTSSLNWVTFPIEEKPNHVFQASVVETKFALQDQTKCIPKEETDVIGGSTIIKRNSLWADIPNDLLSEIFSRLFVGDKVAFRSVCRSWCLVSSLVTTSHIRAINESPEYFPSLMCSHYTLHNTIHGELVCIDFRDMPEGYVRAARYGWLLMQDKYSDMLFFYNPSTKEKKVIPHSGDIDLYYSLSFTAPPTSSDCLVIGGVLMLGGIYWICSVRCGDENWTECFEIVNKNELVHFSFSNAVIHKGLYYFLMNQAQLMIYDPMKDKIKYKKAPKAISRVIGDNEGNQYMLESDDGELMAVFVSVDGSLVYTCQWNVSKMKWKILESLGNRMIFISRPLSFCRRATISGTGNKIYFPRVVGENKILFYSLATKMYHTFEMGTSYPNFLGSKFYNKYNGCWFAN